MLKFTGNTTGEFYLPETDTWFTYTETQDDWAKGFGFKHEIHIHDSVCYATVKKTVAKVCVDEGADGKPVVQSWKISKHNLHTKG